MLTFQKVADAFSDFLDQCEDFEIVPSKYGYVSLGWDRHCKNAVVLDHCKTPEALREMLAAKYETALLLEYTSRGHGHIDFSTRRAIMRKVHDALLLCDDTD